MRNIERFTRKLKTHRNSATAWFHVLSLGAEDFSAKGKRGGDLSRRLDNRKEFFTPLFLTPGAFWWRKSTERKVRRVWPRAGHGWVILISGLHTPLGRLDDYFGSGAGQYLDNTLTGGFVRSSTFIVALFILSRFSSPALARRTSASAFKGWFPLSTLIGHVTNIRANRISQIDLIFSIA